MPARLTRHSGAAGNWRQNRHSGIPNRRAAGTENVGANRHTGVAYWAAGAFFRAAGTQPWLGRAAYGIEEQEE